MPRHDATSDDPSCLKTHPVHASTLGAGAKHLKETAMNSIIYIVGAVVIVIAILSFVGLA